MASVDVHDRPSFQTVEDGTLTGDQAPPSRLAIFAFVAGLVSLLAPLSVLLLPLSVIAIAIGLVVVIQQLRDSASTNSWFANAGLGLGLASAAWTITATTSKADYIVAEASINAIQFVETLASGKTYEALELTHAMGDRQITGTDLAQYYESRTEEEEKDKIQMFIDNPATKLVQQYPDATWKVEKVVQLKRPSSALHMVTLLIRNAENPEAQVSVELQRNLISENNGESVAYWNVLSHSVK